MDSSEEKNQMPYETAIENGLLNSYSEAQKNGQIGHYETALECGDITLQTKEDVDSIFGVTIGRFKKCVTEFKTKPEYYIYRQFKYKCEKERETHALKIELEALRRSHTEIREKYYDLNEKCGN